MSYLFHFPRKWRIASAHYLAMVCRGLSLVVFFLSITALLSCADSQQTNSDPSAYHIVTETHDTVFDLGTYTHLDEQKAMKASADIFTSAGKCSAVVNTTSDGQVLVGRNLDLYITNKPAYYGRTSEQGFLDTVFLTYLPFAGDDTSTIRKNGVRKDFYDVIPGFATDVMNEKGLYIEINMRFDQEDASGKSVFACTGTNPEADTHICATQLPMYLARRCTSVNEAIALAKKLDVYCSSTQDIQWQFAFMLADSSGNYGLMEFGANKLVWLPRQQAQTNFYVYNDWNAIQLYKCGIGRYDILMTNAASVQSPKDMFDLINSVSYFQIYIPGKPCFDIRTEYVENTSDGNGFTTDYVLDDKNRAEIEELIRDEYETIRNMTRQEIQDEGDYWESIFTVVANCTKKTIFVRFFEDDTRGTTLAFPSK